MLSYFLFTLYRMSLTFPFFSQNTKLLILFLWMLNVSNLQNHDRGCYYTGFVPAGSCICVQTFPQSPGCLGMVTYVWTSSWMTKLQENIQREDKGISCLCVEHVDLWNGEEKPFSILYSIQKSPSWKKHPDRNRLQLNVDAKVIPFSLKYEYVLLWLTVEICLSPKFEVGLCYAGHLFGWCQLLNSE